MVGQGGLQQAATSIDPKIFWPTCDERGQKDSPIPAARYECHAPGGINVRIIVGLLSFFLQSATFSCLPQKRNNIRGLKSRLAVRKRSGSSFWTADGFCLALFVEAHRGIGCFWLEAEVNLCLGPDRHVVDLRQAVAEEEQNLAFTEAGGKRLGFCHFCGLTFLPGWHEQCLKMSDVSGNKPLLVALTPL